MFVADAFETKQAIRKGLNSMEFASLPAVMKTAQDLTRKVETLTNYELAGLVGKDPFALAKVMDMANRGCRVDNLSVSKLEDAILKVGFKKVRNLAFSLLDMEAAKAKLRYHEQGETAAYALCACVVAERVMQEVGRLDPQEVYTVTVLRSYGKQLMTAFMIHYYREAISLIPEKGEDAAFHEVFGITPLELTLELLRETKVPRELLRALKPFDPETLELQFIHDTDELIIYSEFALRLTSLVFDFSLSHEEFQKKACELLDYFRTKVLLREDQMFRIVDELGDVINELRDKYKIEALPKGMTQTIKARVKDQDPPPPPPKDPDPDDPSDIEHKLNRNPELLLNDCAREIAWFAAKRPPEKEAIHASLVEGLYRGLRCEHVVVFLRDGDSDEFKSIGGKGPLFEKIHNRLTLMPGTKDIFGVCLQRRYNALVYDSGESAVRPFLPQWLNEFNCNSLMVLPIWDESPEPEPMDDEDQESLYQQPQPLDDDDDEDEGPINRDPFILILCANSNGQTAIQLQNSMSKSLVAIKRQLTKAHVGRAMAPSFLYQNKDADSQLDLGQFMREARKAMQSVRKRAGGVVF